MVPRKIWKNINRSSKPDIILRINLAWEEKINE